MQSEQENIDPVHVMSQTRKSAILPFPMVTYAIQSYIKIPTFLFSFSCLLLMISANLTVVLETHNSNLLVKNISDELTRVYGTHSELLIRPTKIVKSVGRRWLVW